MASSHLKTVRSPTRDDARGSNVLAGRLERECPRTQFDFRAQTDPIADYWRAITIVSMAAIGVVGAILATGYLVGVIAAAIMATAVVALIGFGNWILNNTIDLL